VLISEALSAIFLSSLFDQDLLDQTSRKAFEPGA